MRLAVCSIQPVNEREFQTSTRNILDPSDFDRFLECHEAVLFIYVDWSIYAKQGLQIVEKVEGVFRGDHSSRRPAFWLADVSDESSSGFFIGEWLNAQNSRGIRMFPGIATGNGSLVWIKNGEVVDFALSALHLEVEGIIGRTESAFR